MNAKKTVALVLAVLLLFAGFVRPKEARASNTGLIIVASIAGYLVVIGTATYLIYNHGTPASSTSFLPPTTARREHLPGGRVRLGTECAPTGSSTVWFCW